MCHPPPNTSGCPFLPCVPHRFIGTFLVRVSENRFGYTLSYRIADGGRHYMIEQDTRGRYALRGNEKVCNSLNELIEWFTRHRINPEGDMLREPCGQEVRVCVCACV